MRRQQRCLLSCSSYSKIFPIGFILGCAFFVLTRFAVVPCFWSLDRAIPDGELERENTDLTLTSTTDGNLVLVGIMSAKEFLESRVIPIFDTWAKTIPGKVIVFSSEGSSLACCPDIPLIALPGIDDSYPPQRKSFAMLRYMFDHYRDKFRFFMRADDDVYVHGNVLRPFLHSINSTNRPLFIGQAGLGTKAELGQLSLKNEENFCMGGPGMILSRDTLVRVAPHVNYCLQHLLTNHEDVEIGRCIHQFADVTCTWSYEMQKIMYNNYREPKGSFTHSLKDTDIHLAATLHPVKNASFQYRLHKYFLMRDSLRLLRNKLSKLQRQLNDVATELKESDAQSRYGLHPSLVKAPRAKSRHEVLTWDFVNARTISSARHKNPKRALETHLRLGLTDTIRQVMTIINVNARQRGRVIDYKEVLYGYRRVNPLHGADYMLDLLLVYRKFKGRRKMTVPVRRHAYLQQAFLEPEFHIISPSVGPRSYVPVGVQRSESVTTVHIILPLAGRYETFRQFMDSFESVCAGDDVALMIVLFSQEDFVSEVDLITSRVSASQRRYPHLSISVIRMSDPFSRGAGLQQAAKLLPRHSLMFFIDVDIQFTPDVLQRVRLATSQGHSAYYPVVFNQYDPSMATGSNFTSGTGCWRQSGYGIAAVYNADFMDAGGFDLNIRGWGREDVDLVERLLARNVSIFRAVDPGLVHVFHAKQCDPGLDAAQYQMCLGSKASSYASLRTLSNYVRRTPEIYHRADSNDDPDMSVKVSH